MTRDELTDHLRQSVAGLRAVAVDVLNKGEYPKALRYLAMSKDIHEFIEHERFLTVD